MLAGMIGHWELLLILFAILLVFGARKLPELAQGLGKGIREFRKAVRDVPEGEGTTKDQLPAGGKPQGGE
ncbi:MAG: twin-arginine translocase TatA/TatE family subunit [candidate division KSB1 bacterium]|nr:twin-arginine translocase TatA/TatE family subunit [candidate division KSB1 bacterium]